MQIGYIGLVMAMPRYKYPKPTGQYLVGFREIKIGDNLVSIYYPTQVRSKKNWIYSCRGRNYVKQVYNDFQHVVSHKPPLFVVHWMLGFLNTLKVEDVQVDAPCIDGKLVPILFSNGLGGLKDHYMCFYREWASLGHIVYSIQQEEVTIILTEEEIHMYKTGVATLENEHGKRLVDKIKLIRNQQLDDRVSRFKLLLDYVLQQPNVLSNRVFVVGHSFGGATAFRTAQLDNRVTGGLIMFDPWFLPIKSDDLKQSTRVPLLCVNSETFRLRLENETIQRNHIVFTNQREKLVLMIKGSQHLCCTDLVYQMPFELKMFTKLNNLHQILQTTIAHVRASSLFIETRSCKSTLSRFDEFSTCFKTRMHEVEYI